MTDGRKMMQQKIILLATYKIVLMNKLCYHTSLAEVEKIILEGSIRLPKEGDLNDNKSVHLVEFKP